MARTLFPTQGTLHPKHSTFKIGHKKAKDVGKECLICICKKNQGLSETVVKDVQDARRVFLTELRTLRNVRRGRKRRTTGAKERTLRVVTIFRVVMMKKAEFQEREEQGRQMGSKSGLA